MEVKKQLLHCEREIVSVAAGVAGLEVFAVDRQRSLAGCFPW
jgi:hypothetical protein